MKKVKIVFFDIDGTLVNLGATDMTPNTKEAMRQLKKKDIKICIATGRPMVSIPVFQDITFDVILAFNGSYCVDGEEILNKRPIPYKDVQQIILNAKEMGRPVSIATAKQIVANGTEKDLEDYFAIANKQVAVAKDFNNYLEEDIYQIMMGCSQEERHKILQGTTHSKIAAWWSRAIDIIPIESGKGTAIEKILEHYHFSKEEAIASDVCGDVKDDGIYFYLKEHGII